MNLLSERLNFVMQEAHITQSDLVDASGASYSMVGQWLKGDIKSLSLKFALGIEREYGYNHIWLMINEGNRYADERQISEREAAAVAARETEVKKLQQLVSYYEAATETGRELIMSAASYAPKRAGVTPIDAASNDG